jgi:hypothetical protein
MEMLEAATKVIRIAFEKSEYLLIGNFFLDRHSINQDVPAQEL